MHYHTCRLGKEVMLILIDGPAAVPEVPLHEPLWYALFFFLRQSGTLTGSLEEFVSQMTSADAAEEQLQMLNRFQPDHSRMSQLDRDTAICCVLAKADAIKGMMSRPAGRSMIRSPVTLMQSSDSIGQVFDRVTRGCCCTAMQHIKLDEPHAECMLSEARVQSVAAYVRSTLQAFLRLK